jgi:hypothetical protein
METSAARVAALLAALARSVRAVFLGRRRTMGDARRPREAPAKRGEAHAQAPSSSRKPASS